MLDFKRLTKHANDRSDAMCLTIELRFANGKREEVRISEDTGITRAGCIRYKGTIFIYESKGQSDFYRERQNDTFLDLDTYNVPKPNIEDVYAAFQQHQNEARRAGVNKAQHEVAQAALRDKFRAFGLEDKIDWSDKS